MGQNHHSFFAVNLIGRDQLPLSDSEASSPILYRTEKAGLIPFVTGRADLLNLYQQSVAVTVESDILHGLRVTAGFSFHPKFLPGPAPEVGLAGGNGLFQRRPVHPGHHQHAPGLLVLHDGRDQTVSIELQLIVKGHRLLGRNVISIISEKQTNAAPGTSAESDQPYRYPLARQEFFDIADGELAEVKDTGGENSVGISFEQHLRHVLQRTCATAGYDRHPH